MQSIPILPEPSDASSSSYATALKDKSGPPTTQDDPTQHEGKTLQQMIEEGAGSSQQHPIDIDQFDDGPGSSYGNPIDVDNPVDTLTLMHSAYFLDDLMTHSPKQWGETDDGPKSRRNRSNPSHGRRIIRKHRMFASLGRG